MRGSFCFTCGFYDYIDDFKLILEDLGMNVQLLSVEETWLGSYCEVCGEDPLMEMEAFTLLVGLTRFDIEA